MDPNLAALDQVRITTIDLAMKFGPKLLVAIIIMVAGYLAARWAAGVVGSSLRRFDFEPPVRQLMLSFTRALVLILFAIMALQNLGVELLPLIAGIGVAGAGIALAMQGVLSNLVAGLTIILTRPFRVGEYISIAREEGEVAEIRLASTTLSHADRSRVVIPNRRIVGEILHNYGQIRQLQVKVGVAYDTDLNQSFAAVREALESNPRILKDPAPVLGVASFGDAGVVIGVHPWARVPDFGPAGDEIHRAILDVFRKRGIVIPPPRREITMLEKAA
jgi:small conductance mechanosensitive channel